MLVIDIAAEIKTLFNAQLKWPKLSNDNQANGCLSSIGEPIVPWKWGIWDSYAKFISDCFEMYLSIFLEKVSCTLRQIRVGTDLDCCPLVKELANLVHNYLHLYLYPLIHQFFKHKLNYQHEFLSSQSLY